MSIRSLVWFLSLATAPAVALAAEPERREWTVGGLKREALVVAPESAGSKPSPLVFAFHGHGGTMRNVSRSMPIHQLWPEAVVVYMQGVNTPGRLTDPEGRRPGWQHAAGDHGDRDLKFFDAVLKSLRADYKIDESRIYATGHSNGGGFTYLLWAERGDVFAAVAPSAALANPRLRDLRPKPVLHLAGEKDALVKFEWQKLTMEKLRRINGTGDDGKPRGKFVTIYGADRGMPVATYVHPGAHNYPREAPAVIAEFFKEHVKPGTKAP